MFKPLIAFCLSRRAIILVGLLLFGALYSYRAVAYKRLRNLDSRLATVPDAAANAPNPKFFFQRGVSFTTEFPA